MKYHNVKMAPSYDFGSINQTRLIHQNLGVQISFNRSLDITPVFRHMYPDQGGVNIEEGDIINLEGVGEFILVSQELIQYP